MRTVPFQLLLPVNVRLVFRGVDGHKHFRCKLIAFYATDDMQRFSDCELSIHASSRNPHALLAAALAELVEFRAIEEFSENARDLGFDNSRAVVFHNDTRPSVVIAHLHPDIGEDPSSSQASSALSTVSLTAVTKPLEGVSKPSRWRFLRKNS